MTEKAMEIMCDNGTVWVISTSSWSGKSRLTASDIGKEASDILDIIELGQKRIIPDDVRRKLLNPRSQVQALMSKFGKPFFLLGSWWVPNKNLSTVKEGLEKIQESQDEIVRDLIDHFADLQQEMIQAYPILEAAEWPTETEIRGRFRITWLVIEVKGTSMKETDPEELTAAKATFNLQLKNEYESYKDQILAEAKQAIVDACMEISGKVKDGASIRTTTIKKPLKIIEDYMNIADIFDLDDVRAEVQKVKDKLESVTTQQLKTDWQAAQAFSKSMSTMAEKIGDLSGLSKDGRVKRVVTKQQDREAT